MMTKKGGERIMELFKRLLVEEDGQGLVEYTLIVVLVALVFWVAIRNTNIGSQLASGWGRVPALRWGAVGATSCCGDPGGSVPPAKIFSFCCWWAGRDKKNPPPAPLHFSQSHVR